MNYKLNITFIVALSACQGGTSVERSSGVETGRVVATVDDDPIQAVVPDRLRDDPAAYEHMVRGLVYRRGVLRRAAAAGVTLSADELAVARAAVPSADAAAGWLATSGQTYDDLLDEAAAVALIQKMERREVFDSITVSDDDVRSAFEARRVASGPRRFYTVVALRVSDCGDTAMADARRLADALDAAPVVGHRLDVGAAAVAVGLAVDAVWAIDVHLDDESRLIAAIVASRDPGIGVPGWGLERLSELAVRASDSGYAVVDAVCQDGTVLLAKLVGATGERPLELGDVADEIRLILRAERERPAFDRYFAQVLADTPAVVTPLEEVLP